MPELVARGPAIPVSLMNELDSSGVVFFCGAGISEGEGSGLPGFAGLVKYVYSENDMLPDAVEREALDLDEEDRGRRRPSLDKALELLERPERLGAHALRRTVMDRLSRPPTGELGVHKALIALSRSDRGIRLITTNFDNRFVESEEEIPVVDAAPKLPVPTPYSWASLVHLHGRIVSGTDGSNLVLTAADFGRAYLTERWASRFVTELFREFTVVFVGYGIGDPVISYMVDALAAERGKGARFAGAYAFAPHDGTGLGERRARDGWRAKNVTPILYHDSDKHRLLGETLIEWARIRSDPFHARSRIAVKEILNLPAGASDPAVERVTWALQDPVAAKALADAPPILDENDYPKVGNWLKIFSESGLLSCAGTDASPVAEGQGSADIRLVTDGAQSRNPGTLDRTRAHLARWLANHLHVPQVLEWVLKNGGHLHPGLRLEVLSRLSASDSIIPPRLRTVWTIVAHQEPTDHWEFLWASQHHRAADSELERRQIEDDTVQSLIPRLCVQHGPVPWWALQGAPSKKQDPLQDLCHLKLVAGDPDSWIQIEHIARDNAVLARHAATLTGYLQQALVLADDADSYDPDSSLYRPSIAPHDQNSDDHDWTVLIDLARDSYLALTDVDRARGDNLLRDWALSKKPLFRRLALHALTEDTKSDIRILRKLLLGGRSPGLWESELRREVLRFLRLGGARMPRSLRVEIVRAIHAGPKTKKRKLREFDGSAIRHEKALRLQKLAASGARLDKGSKRLASEFVPDMHGDVDDRDEFTLWHGKARRIGTEEFVPSGLLRGSISDVVAATRASGIGREGFRGLAISKPVKAASALRRLAKEGEWPAACWRGFLEALHGLRNGPKRYARLNAFVGQFVSGAPDGFVADVGPFFSHFVKDLAEDLGADREQELRTLWEQVWSGVGKAYSPVGDADDLLTQALNHSAGILAEAALVRLWKHKPKNGEALPTPVRPYFDAIDSDPEGHLARVMLATRLHPLFAIDPRWTREHLISRLSPADCDEARDLWSAYGWSPTVGPDLLLAYKRPFLDMLCRGGVGDRSTRSLRSLFIAICLGAPGELAAEDIRRVVGSMSEEGLADALRRLAGSLKGDPVARARVWRETIQPWLQRYWPTAAARNTAATSVAMLDMLVEAGDAFPEAAQWCLQYLQATGGLGLDYLHESDHASRHPRSMLDLLDAVVATNDLAPHLRSTLHEILDSLHRIPEMAADSRFQRLFAIASG